MDIIHLIDRIHPHRLKVFVDTSYFEYRKATWRFRPLPEFLIIGAQKSGTSSLHSYLCQHPQLFSSPYKKEIHYFSTLKFNQKEKFENGEHWYRAHFPRQREMCNGSMTFETTPDYIFHPPVPARIHALSPEMKLIALLRNPTERAISNYFMENRKNREPLPMLEAFQQEEARIERAVKEQDYNNQFYIDTAYKSRGRYAEQLARFLVFFPAKQILLLSSEELFSDPYGSLRKVYDFLDVDPDFKINDIAPRNIGRKKGEVPAGVREYLDEYFQPYNQTLYQLAGKNFGW